MGARVQARESELKAALDKLRAEKRVLEARAGGVDLRQMQAGAGRGRGRAVDMRAYQPAEVGGWDMRRAVNARPYICPPGWMLLGQRANATPLCRSVCVSTSTRPRRACLLVPTCARPPAGGRRAGGRAEA